MKVKAVIDKLSSLDPEMEVFPLLGQDILAPDVIDDWCFKAGQKGVDPAKTDEAKKCADRMRKAFIKKKLPD